MFQTLLLVCASLFLLMLARFVYLASQSGKKSSQLKQTSPCKTLVILGSGGHTAEMLRLLSGMRLQNYSPRIYVVADNDTMSVEKAKGFESDHGGTADIRLIPRARQVRQSYTSSIFSTATAFIHCFPLVWSTLPELILSNGPGTCIPICFSAYMLKFLGVRDIKIVYVESICRVEQLSLSAVLLYYIADHLLVQWPQLKQRYSRTHYIGRLV